MVGQTNLLNNLNKYNIDTFPRSILLLGEKGCGKHTIAKHIQENIIKLPLLDITSNLSDEYIDNIYRNPNPTIYLIDLSEMTEKEQNILLKFVEEPLKNAFILLLAEQALNVLPTVYNRCVSFEFEPYNEDELAQFISDKEDKDTILKFLRTPGKILNINLANLKDMQDTSEKIAEKLSIANYSNALTIANKINYKDEYNKFDLEIFLDVLADTLAHKFIYDHNEKTLPLYLTFVNERKKLMDKRINKEIFIQHLLTKLWKVSQQ